MTVVESFFVDSNLLLYYVDPQNLQKQARATECSIIFGSLEPAAARQIVGDLAHRNWKPMDWTPPSV